MSGNIIGTGRGSFRFLRMLVSQDDYNMEVKLSVFRVHVPIRTITLRDTKILTYLLSVIEKFIDRLETKMTNVDLTWSDSMSDH